MSFEQEQRSALIDHLLASHDATEAYGFPATRKLKGHHDAAHGRMLYGAVLPAASGHGHADEMWDR